MEDEKWKMKKRLRWGYTTGACAAAAAKAATSLLLSVAEQQNSRTTGTKKQICCATAQLRYCSDKVDIPFPDGERHKFKIQDLKSKMEGQDCIARASVIKDAGDDPDVTNGAEIVAEVKIINSSKSFNIVQHSLNSILIKGGAGVGVVTKPGLPVPVGEAAINPVPRRMIEEAVREAILEQQNSRTAEQKFKEMTENPTTVLQHYCTTALEITISVVNGEEIAKKTLNSRLGIMGGISILGTTGYVKPVSAEAWTATIRASMDVARAMGHEEIVLSAGRASEKAHMKRYNLSEESYVLMGDYLAFSLEEAKKRGFKRIHLCAQWAKMLKIAMATPQTHVKFGAIDLKKTKEFLNSLEITLPSSHEFNTARQIYEFIKQSHTSPSSLFSKVCTKARRYAEEISSGVPVITHLVSYNGEVIATSE